MSNLYVLFPGQGSQYTHMGLDFPESEELLKKIHDVIGIDLMHIIKTGEHLSDTMHAQLAIYFHSVLAFQYFLKLNPNYQGIAGFSLGEYTSLYASHVFDFEQTLNIIHKRATFMHKASISKPGFMAAVLGLDRKTVELALKKVKNGIMVVANVNGYEQIVISGEKLAFEEASHHLKLHGAKRIIPLSVSGAFHSPLMNEAAKELYSTLQHEKTSLPNKPIYHNVTGQKSDNKTIKEQLINHMIKPVEFVKMIECMKNDGCTHIIEIGSGKVLTNLIKKIDPHIETYSFEKFEQVDDLKGWLNQYGFIK